MRARQRAVSTRAQGNQGFKGTRAQGHKGTREQGNKGTREQGNKSTREQDNMGETEQQNKRTKNNKERREEEKDKKQNIGYLFNTQEFNVKIKIKKAFRCGFGAALSFSEFQQSFSFLTSSQITTVSQKR